MSVVTGIMLLTCVGDEDEMPIAEVQRWLADREWPPLIEVSGATGGSKHPQYCAWGAGFNCFVDEKDFVEFVLARDWLMPENVVLTMKPEEGPTVVYRPKGH